MVVHSDKYQSRELKHDTWTVKHMARQYTNITLSPPGGKFSTTIIKRGGVRIKTNLRNIIKQIRTGVWKYCSSSKKRILISPGLRLVGGDRKGEGRVEIFYNGTWGTVCDDDWDINDARVVCQHLGFSNAVRALGSAHFGSGSGEVWLDNVGCSGSESSIENCSHNGWGVGDCTHKEDASVTCSST